MAKLPAHEDPKKYLTSRRPLTPDQIANEKEAIETCIGQVYRDAIARCGMTPAELALLRLQQLQANKISHIKMRGRVALDKSAGAEYRRVAMSDGEDLIEHTQPDWATREKAMTAVEILMGYNVREEERNKGTIILVNTNIPESRPAIPDETLARLWAHRKDETGETD